MNTIVRRSLRLTMILACVSVLLQGLAAGSVARAAGGKIVWSLEGISELSTLDPAKVTDSVNFIVINMLYGRLVKLDKDLKVTPDLADKWEISSDGKTYTLHLRDAKFSDGSAITADDVLYSLNYAFDPNVGGQNASYYLGAIAGVDDFVKGITRSIAGATAPDAKTVILQIASPSAVFLEQLTFGVWIISKTQVSGNPKWADQPVTSGAFSVKDWKHNQAISIRPNPGYWQVPSVDEIDFQFIQDSETAYQLYKTGQLDIAGSQQNGIPVPHIAEELTSPEFHQAPNLAIRFIGFNNAVPPFDNLNVRRAFALAIDKDKLANMALGGAVIPAHRILPFGLPGSDLPITPLKFDAVAAQKALADSGFTAQSLPPITITYGIEGDNQRVLTFLQSMWKDTLGIAVQLKPMDLDQFSDSLNTLYQDPRKSTIQAFYSFWGADYPDPQNFLSQQLRTDVGNNNGHWSDPQFDALVDKADVMKADDPTRFKLYQQAEQIAIDKVGWLPIFFPKLNVLIKPDIEGVVLNGGGIAVPDYTKLKGH